MFVKFLFTAITIFSAVTCEHLRIFRDVVPKIIGGDQVSIVDYPYQVSIRGAGRRHFCGGSLISPRYVLSAAHCFVQNTSQELSPWRVTVAMGHSRLEDMQQVHRVSHILAHEDYSPESFPIVNDIALLRLLRPARVDNIAVAVIPLAEKPPPPGTTCTVSGWGAITPNSGVVNQLRAVKVPIAEEAVCARLTWLHEGVVCAGPRSGGKDSCQGDSGGPLACGGRLSGVVSWGEGCALPDKPGVYTDVSFFADWIAEHSHSPPPSKSSLLLAASAIVALYTCELLLLD